MSIPENRESGISSYHRFPVGVFLLEYFGCLEPIS